MPDEMRILGLPRIAKGRFDYDPTTGHLTYKLDPDRATFRCDRGFNGFLARFAGRHAGSVSRADGYLRVSVNGRSIMAHRLIWALITGRDPGATIDHRDGNRANNRWSNLREATRSQNAMNRRSRRDCASGIRGVYWHRVSNMWAAQITAGGVSRHLGTFKTKAEAANAFSQAAESLHGDFAAHLGALAGYPGHGAETWGGHGR